MIQGILSNDDAEYERWDDKLGFLTPILKGCLTELGLESANLGMQVFGGHGYIREHGMEQIVRDARIATLYEGTTGIQALDLLGRKVLLMTQGKAVRDFTRGVARFAVDLLKNRAGACALRPGAAQALRPMEPADPAHCPHRAQATRSGEHRQPRLSDVLRLRHAGLVPGPSRKPLRAGDCARAAASRRTSTRPRSPPASSTSPACFRAPRATRRRWRSRPVRSWT